MALEPSLHPMERQGSMFPLSFAPRLWPEQPIRKTEKSKLEIELSQVSRQLTPRMKTRIEKGGSRYFSLCPLILARKAIRG
ncbi:MAG: hypothetical protein ACM3N3_18805 [Betaproteobacteria bacterium]